MNLGKNLQFLRKMNRHMTQEALAERLSVSRQTISRWEMGEAFPEMEKLLQLCDIFACTLDELVRGDLGAGSEAYSEVHLVSLPAFRCYAYPVVSAEPETDAISHQQNWAKEMRIEPDIIGWDFPILSQEQINVYHMHGYVAGCILPEEFNAGRLPVMDQRPHRYAVITIKDPASAPFALIPNAYKVVLRYLESSGLAPYKEDPTQIGCFEKEYEKDGIGYMDIYFIAD